MRTSDATDKIVKAVLGFQADVKPVAKDSVNPHFRNKYASLSAIVEAIKPTLKKHKLATIQGFDVIEDGVIGLVTRVVHESGQFYESTLPMPVEKRTPQATGSAITYARRYALCAALGIVADDDDDANAASKPGRKRKPKASDELPDNDSDLPI